MTTELKRNDTMGDRVAHFLCKVRTAVTHGMGKSSLGPDIWGQWYRVDKDKRTEQVMRDEVAKLGLQTELESQDSTIDIVELRGNMLKIKVQGAPAPTRLPTAVWSACGISWPVRATARICKRVTPPAHMPRSEARTAIHSCMCKH